MATVQAWMKEAAAEIEAGKGRCPICRWPLAKSADDGCVIGNCSYRPGDHQEQELRDLREHRERWEATVQIIAQHAPAEAPMALEPEGMREVDERQIAEYTKKPITIKAFRWFGDELQMQQLFELLGSTELPHAPDDPHIHSGFGFTPSDGRVTIPTLEGTMTANPGDWIIRGIKGELYPCKPDIFADTYKAGAAGPKEK